MTHKYDHQTISTVNSTRPLTPKNGVPVQAGLLVQDAPGGEFEVADGTKPILGVVIGLEGTTGVIGLNQSIAVQSEEITCQVDGDYSDGQAAYSTVDGKATASDTNPQSAFGIFSKSKVGNIAFVRRL
jgi:hypothetical protein